MNDNIILYQNGEIELKISVENETIWLNQKQIALLFDVEIHTINYHIKNIFKSTELDKVSTIRKIRIVQKEGNRNITRDVEHYNLDMIISVGYRVNSLKATKFRKWATNILKQYILNNYAINSKKITIDRFLKLENDVFSLKENIQEHNKILKSNQLEIKQGIFYNGQIFDAYIFVNSLLEKAKNEVILIDNYIDNSTLVILSKYDNLKFTITTKSIDKQLKLDIQKYNQQYNNLTIKISNKYHDRFIIIDEKEAYHIGASIKDLGKKVFAFSKIELNLIYDKEDKNVK